MASNRQASYRFELLERFEAGIVLTGTEVKSLRDGRAQIKDAYATVEDGEVWLHNLHIPPYPPAAHDNHAPERDRKLLLHRREIERLIGKTQERGLTLVPTRGVLLRPPRQGRAGAGPRKGPLRQARIDPGARDEARGGEGDAAALEFNLQNEGATQFRRGADRLDVASRGPGVGLVKISPETIRADSHEYALAGLSR